MSGPGEGSSAAADEVERAQGLFETFLEQHHSGGGDLGELCALHPEHAARFRRWWEHLSEVGELDPGAALDAADEPDDGGLFGPYRVLGELGRGAQATVYLAEDTRLGRQVALKVLPRARLCGRDPERRFAREAELASRLDHPGLCTVFERGLHGATAFLAMRLVEGETLAAAIARGQRQREAAPDRIAVRLGTEEVDERTAVERLLLLFEKVARALHAAHEARLVHRDVKPGNIMVDRAGEPVLLDFGLARDLEDEAPTLTRTGDLVGTPAYMPPEQLLADRDLDRRADLYALAATLYECLTLHRPIEAATRAELYRRIVEVEPVRVRRRNRALPRDLDRVLEMALQKDRARRYPSAAEFAEDLRRVRCREPILARPSGPLGRGWRWARRNRGLAASLSAVFAALCAGLLVSLYAQAETQRARADEQRLLGRLTDEARLDDAARVARELSPILPERASALAAWLAAFGEPLAAALSEHRRELERLRSRALAEDPESLARARADHPDAAELARLRIEVQLCEERLATEDVRDRVRPRLERFTENLALRIAALEGRIAAFRPHRFASRGEQALHDGLARLVARLEAFVAADGLLPRMRAHHAWAAAGAGPLAPERAAAWQAAAAFAARTEGPYGGRALGPQPGFVPLGLDPASGLLEFGFERSGRIPVRDPESGRLDLDATSALVFVLVPGGAYRMGRDDPVLRAEERVEREVELDWFLIQKHELSRQQWETLTGREAPDDLLVASSFEVGPDHPVDFLPWDEAVGALAEFGLELPTEAQWECAAAGGTRTRWWWGDGAPPGGRLFDNLRGADGFAATAPVHADFVPNPFGLCAVHGNAAEWCRDPFMPRTPIDRFTIRPGDGLLRLPALGMRAVRGGRFDSAWQDSRVAARAGLRGEIGQVGVGVRAVAALR